RSPAARHEPAKPSAPVSTTTRQNPPSRLPQRSFASRLAGSGLRRNEFASGRHKFVRVKLRGFERTCDHAILLEHRRGFIPILVGHPTQRLACGVGCDPRIERQLRLPSRYGRDGCFREFFDDGHHLFDMRAAIEKALEAGGDEAADELGVLLDEVGMDNDAVAHCRHTAIGIPKNARLFVAADLDARHIALRVAGYGGNPSGDQSWRTFGRGDIGDADLAGIEPAAPFESPPLLELGCPPWYCNGFSLQVFRRLDIRVLQHHDRGRIAPEDSRDHLDAHPLDTLLPTTKPSAKPNCVALLATSWAVLPDPLPGPISTLRPACS